MKFANKEFFKEFSQSHLVKILKQGIEKMAVFSSYHNPIVVLIWGYCLITLIGFCFLSFPFVQKTPTGIIDHLFIAVSAISTTGLCSASLVQTYNFWGQLVILILIQIGGVGYMTFASFLILITEKKLTKTEKSLLRSEFGLPENFNLRHFVRSVVVFSFMAETIGAIALYFIFRGHQTASPCWEAIFHSVSAFCTSGMSLFNRNLEGFANDPWLNVVIMLLSFMGAVGFIVVTDLWRYFRRKEKTISLTSKIILVFTTGGIIAGTTVLFLTESFNQTTSIVQRLWFSVFHSATALTTVGFNTFPIGQLSHSSLYLLVILMFMGASPAGTGGGIKSTTIVAILSQMMSTLKGEEKVTFLGREIPAYRLRMASASFNFYIVILAIGIFFLNMTDDSTIFQNIFEATSALGTVGLSMGITGQLSFLGKSILIALMMLGRIGPLTIGSALLYEKFPHQKVVKKEDVVI